MEKKITGYCVECKSCRDMLGVKRIVMKNAKPALSGECRVCGAEIFKVLSKEEEVNCPVECGSFKIGIMVESLRMGTKKGIQKCAEMGADGVQIYAVNGDLAPENLSKSGRDDLLKLIKDNNLVVSALCGDLGGHGFARADDNERKIAKSIEILRLAIDLQTSVVTTHVGVISDDENDPGRKAIKDACEEIGRAAEDMGVRFAIETGPEKAETLKGFLDGLKTRAVAVNFDPANLVMVTCDDPVKGVHTLKDYIVHTHAKDGICIKKADPSLIYGYFAEGPPEGFSCGDYFKEVPLGEGDVDFEGYIAALREICYDGFLTIEREVGDNPLEDIAGAVNFLRKY